VVAKAGELFPDSRTDFGEPDMAKGKTKPLCRWETGVYTIVCRPTGKVYVGSSAVCLRGRLNGHKVDLRKGTHGNLYLQRAWNKYGAGAFEFSVVRKCGMKVCLKWEQFFIDSLKAADPKFGFNLSPTAGSLKGLRWSEESKVRGSEAQTKVFADPEERKRRSEIAKRRFQDPEERERISKKLKGRKLPLATRMKMAERMRKRYSDPIARLKTSLAARRQWADPVIRAKMVAAAGRRRKEV
jgi:group I intron endonuclease